MTIPAVPIADALNQQLISFADYQRFTTDLISTSVQVTAAIEDATEDLCKALNRTLAYARYTENLYLTKTGMVYPSATPIDKAAIVSAGNTLYDPNAPKDGSSVIQGYGIWVGFFTPLPWMPVWTGTIQPQTVVTYSGGFHPYGVSGSTESLPSALARLIAKIAWYYLHLTALSELPGGVKSVSLGGVSMSGDISALAATDHELERGLRRWKRLQAHAW